MEAATVDGMLRQAGLPAMGDIEGIGCTALIPTPDHDFFVSIECNKGRGRILPGGKPRVGETFKEAVLREAHEEVGLHGCVHSLIWHGMNTDLFYCYAFRVGGITYAELHNVVGRDFGAGRVVMSTWEQLMTGKFRAYYDLLRDAYRG